MSGAGPGPRPEPLRAEPLRAEPLRVLIADPIDVKAEEIFREESIGVDSRPDIGASELAGVIENYSALMVRSRTQVDARIIAAGKSLKVIGRAGAGVDNIDIGAATRAGIIVMNTPGGNTVSTAEHTISMMLALARNIPRADESVRSGKWDRKSFTGTEVSGKTLGVVGFGRVGREVARRAAGLDMNVIVYDPVVGSEAAEKIGARLVALDELFAGSDFITLHTPLTPETANLISAKTLARCRRGVRLVNCARGEIVDEAALLAALDNGQVAGAALDVFSTEPPANKLLIAHPKVICTPHLGASTDEAQEKVALQAARQMVDFLKGRGIAGSVNADMVQLAMKADLEPFLHLCGRMGSLLEQLKTGTVISLAVTLSGRTHLDAGDLFLAGVIRGFLETKLSMPLNYLNARILAEERGIRTQVKTDDRAAGHPLEITAICTTDRESRGVSGTVYRTDDVRIIGIDGFPFEMKPEGNLLVYYNIDRPGMLAAVSGVLAGAAINIGGLHLGRTGYGGQALTVVSTDSAVGDDIIRKINEIDGVTSVRRVIL